ncbi:hypothetical protein Sste5346_006453 [Sporothrix stenoceras]|uniref:Uncharacterized protein n=1 Tax=Sporothrix stenoceras TaxID=5173 RepID=A0ABR3YZC8_9PEZI
MDKITSIFSTSPSTSPAATAVTSQQLRAKAKLDAVMQGRGHHTTLTNRIGTTRHPSVSDGSAGIANSVSHPPRRPSTGGMLKRINSQPAY